MKKPLQQLGNNRRLTLERLEVRLVLSAQSWDLAADFVADFVGDLPQNNTLKAELLLLQRRSIVVLPHKLIALKECVGQHEVG